MVISNISKFPVWFVILNQSQFTLKVMNVMCPLYIRSFVLEAYFKAFLIMYCVWMIDLVCVYTCKAVESLFSVQHWQLFQWFSHRKGLIPLVVTDLRIVVWFGYFVCRFQIYILRSGINIIWLDRALNIGRIAIIIISWLDRSAFISVEMEFGWSSTSSLCN